MWDVEHPGRGARAIADGVIVMTGIPENESVDVAALDAAVGKVRAGLPSWVALPVEEKAGLMHRLRRRFGDEAPGMVEDWRVAQGLEPDSHWMGDVWAGLVPLAMMIRGRESTLIRLARRERLVAPHDVSHDAQGQVTVDAFPALRTDRLLFPGYSGRVRLQPGTSVAELAAVADAYRAGSSRTPASPSCSRAATTPTYRDRMPSRCCSGMAARW